LAIRHGIVHFEVLRNEIAIDLAGAVAERRRDALDEAVAYVRGGAKSRPDL
jgi:hypothetical protein